MDIHKQYSKNCGFLKNLIA